jgi:hypothetical protein
MKGSICHDVKDAHNERVEVDFIKFQIVMNDFNREVLEGFSSRVRAIENGTDEV